MSDPLLKAIIQLYAIVAKENKAAGREKELIELFLDQHLNRKSVVGYLSQYKSFSQSLSQESSDHEKKRLLQPLCDQINAQLTQKQKTIIILELVSIILADQQVSEKEDELLNIIAQAFRIPADSVDKLRMYVAGQDPSELDIEDVVIISDQDPGRRSFKFMAKEGVKGFVAVLWLQEIDTYFLKYQGDLDLHLNGVYLGQGTIRVLGSGSTVKSDKIEAIYHADVVARFTHGSYEERITFEAENIHFKFKNGKLGLRGINLNEESGHLVGIMGSSGSGKSTLLHVLNGSDKPSEGKVLINGIDIYQQPGKIEGVIGFVPQDDLLIEDLTVYQNLYYTARLCFKHLSEPVIDQLVLKTLKDLGLTETRDLKVGSVMQKTISGGQRKRLSIGLELLRQPAVLFVDEPTSGLSSRDSENIMDLLKELSLKGKLVFVVIHQPSSDIFKLFDRLVILDVGGYQIYYGNPIDAVTYFKKEIQMIESDQGECIECGNVNPEQIFNIIETRIIDEYGNLSDERKISPDQWHKAFENIPERQKVAEEESTPKSTLYIPGKIRQTLLFMQRDLQAKLHNRQYLVINLLEAPLLATLLAVTVRYFNPDIEEAYSFGKNVNIPAYFFMSVIVALFMGLTVSAEEILKDRKILKREALLHLSWGSYLLSKISLLFVLSAVQTLSFVIIGNAILEIDDMLLSHWIILFSTSCTANLVGLNISSAFDSAVTVYILIPLLLIPQLTLSGVVVKFDHLNPSFSDVDRVPLLGDLTTSRWAFEAAMVTQFKDNPFEKRFYTYDRVMAHADFKKTYFIPTLQSKLEYCLNNFKKQDEEAKETLKKNLSLIARELTNELTIVGKDKFPEIDQLTLSGFDSSVYQSASHFVESLKKFYIRRYNVADKAKDQLIISMTDSVEKMEQFKKMKAGYYNETLAELVKNQNEIHRIVEKNGSLHQKIFPIYMKPNPNYYLDFRTQFYVPQKYFLGLHIDTLYFNLGIIWLMSLTLFVLLYFEVLRKVVHMLGDIPQYFVGKEKVES